MNKINHN